MQFHLVPTWPNCEEKQLWLTSALCRRLPLDGVLFGAFTAHSLSAYCPPLRGNTHHTDTSAVVMAACNFSGALTPSLSPAEADGKKKK